MICCAIKIHLTSVRYATSFKVIIKSDSSVVASYVSTAGWFLILKICGGATAIVGMAQILCAR